MSSIGDKAIEAGSLDIGMYRDDIDTRPKTRIGPTEIPEPIDGKVVVLTDDVLFTGRTIRAALDALVDLGRPSAVQLAVVVDRGHRQLPIRADYVGKNIPTAITEHVAVRFAEIDGDDGVYMGDSARKRFRKRGRRVNDLLTTEGLSKEMLTDLLDEADEFAEVLTRPIPKVPALRGKTVATMFFEPSTRTRMSFEKAAKALSADTVSFSPGTSALSKGESLKDTALTVHAMGVDLMVVRHKNTGAPQRLAEWLDIPIVNGGDGAHQHPTQALLDCLTIRQRFGTLEGLNIAIVGDIKHSRVARSDIFAMSTLGANVTLVGPPTLLPLDPEEWPVEATHDLDAQLDTFDVVYLLRVQNERGGGSVFPSVSEYTRRFGMTTERFNRLSEDAIVMHPGPMNRGVEIGHDVADDERSLILQQVTNGVATRMAVLFALLGGDRDA